MSAHLGKSKEPVRQIMTSISCDSKKDLLSNFLMLRLLQGNIVQLSQARDVANQLSSLCCTYSHLKTKLVEYLKDSEASNDFINELLEWSCVKVAL